MFATLLTIALVGIALYLVVVARRAPARRRPLSQPVQSEVPCRHRVPAPHRSPSPPCVVAVLVAACSSGAGQGVGRPPRAPAAGAIGASSPTRASRRRSSSSGSATSRASSSRQFYLAQQNGYYADAGLDVEFQNKIDPDLIPLVGAGRHRRRDRRRDQRHPGRQPGHPGRYVATIYGKFPNVVFAKASSGIKTAADLKGKKIGTPGRYGSGWIMLQALLASANLKPTTSRSSSTPTSRQAAAVEQGAVDAATGFANNEPVQLEHARHQAGRPADRRRSRRCRARA